MTMRDPVEKAGEPAGLCDCCGRLGRLGIGICAAWMAPEWWCEDCRNACEPKDVGKSNDE